MDTFTDIITIHSTYLWLILGASLILAEMLLFPGMGLLFAGLAALSVGILTGIGLYAETDYLLQIGTFLVLTGIWAAILWKPLKRFGAEPSSGVTYRNIVGTTGKISSTELNRQDGGQVRWSGTIMQARLDEQSSRETLSKGTGVTITGIAGNILIVRANDDPPSGEESDQTDAITEK